MAFDKRLFNVCMLGLGFMLVFTAFQTTGNIQATVLASIGDGPEYSKAGFISLAIVYVFFAAFNWVAPSVISLTGPRISMVIGSICYTFFILTFLWPSLPLLYVASVIVGIGAAMIWTGQGNYLTMNSDSTVMARNSGIFWAMLQCSMFIGNIFVFFQFKGVDKIDADTRRIVFTVLSVLAAVGVVVLATLRPARNVSGEAITKDDSGGPLEALKSAAKLCKNRDMLLLMMTFFYTGLELSFFSGVYSTSVGNTQHFEGAKELVGLSGVLIGVGEVLGGLLFSILGSKTNRWGRDPIVIVGFIFHMVSFFLVFINLPNDSPISPSTGHTYIEPSKVVAMLCSFFLGFGDSCYNTQIYSAIGSIWSENSAPAFAMFKFVQSVGAAVCFFYSTELVLQAQLGILIGFATIGTVSFCFVEWLNKIAKKKNNRSESDVSSIPEPTSVKL